MRFVLSPFENRQRIWIVIKQNQGAANGSTWQQVAAFIFLERTRPSANHQSGGFLRKTQFLREKTLNEGDIYILSFAF
jgi:hypothetical protein